MREVAQADAKDRNGESLQESYFVRMPSGEEGQIMAIWSDGTCAIVPSWTVTPGAVYSQLHFPAAALEFVRRPS